MAVRSHFKIRSHFSGNSVFFVTFSVLVANLKTTLYGGQSHLRSAEQGKRTKLHSLAAPLLPPSRCWHGKKKLKKTRCVQKRGQKQQMGRRAQRDASTSVRQVPIQDSFGLPTKPNNWRRFAGSTLPCTVTKFRARNSTCVCVYLINCT